MWSAKARHASRSLCRLRTLKACKEFGNPSELCNKVGTRAELPPQPRRGGAKRRGGVDQEIDFLEPTAPPLSLASTLCAKLLGVKDASNFYRLKILWRRGVFAFMRISSSPPSK